MSGKRLSYLLKLIKAHGVLNGMGLWGWGLWIIFMQKYLRLQDQMGWLSYAAWLKAQPGTPPGPKPLETAEKRPALFHIMIYLQDAAHPNDLAVTLQSLDDQTEANWRAYIFSLSRDTGIEPHSADPRITWVQTAQAKAPLNIMIEQIIAPNPEALILWMAPGDRLPAYAFNRIRLIFESHPEADIIYADEDAPAEGTQPSRPFFKPDFSPELLFSTNYLENAWYRGALIEKCARAFTGDIHPFIQAEWMLMCVDQARQVLHVSEVLYHRGPPREGASGLSHANLPGTRQPDYGNSLARRLKQKGWAQVECRQVQNGWRAHWETASVPVSIIIPNHDNLPFLRRCLESIQQSTHYPDYEIVLVDNDSQDPAVLKYYQDLSRNPRVRVHRYEDAFNFSRYLNRGASLAQGEVFVFLNNDVEVLEPDWLDEFVQWLSLPEIGVVGARLLYPNGAIQHAGIVMGLGGYAGHVYLGQSPETQGPYVSPAWYRNVSAVTGACLGVRRNVFESMGGFKEDYRLVFSDVEFCLRVIQSGKRILYNPFISLIHHEGMTRGHLIHPEDSRLAYQDFLPWIKQGDAYFNPNLSTLVSCPTLKRTFEPDSEQICQAIFQRSL